jgi:serine O-acetyltransferase
MMKDIFKQFSRLLELTLVSPQLILFYLTTSNKFIQADVERWVTIFQWTESSQLINLLTLISRNSEFRNLYYHRISKGNFYPKILMKIMKLFYPESPLLFIDASCNIGQGLFIQHGFSTIIMADMGENCWVNQQVSIGYKDNTGRPKIGNNVRITAGAKVLGNINVGDNVTVGANAVVTKNVPDNCVVVGVPAYIIKRNGLKVQEKLV